jgi:serine/threonine-protein kinase
LLGRGGMATVYLAARADGQFEQTVALKVLDRAGDRFRSLVFDRADRGVANDPAPCIRVFP